MSELRTRLEPLTAPTPEAPAPCEVAAAAPNAAASNAAYWIFRGVRASQHWAASRASLASPRRQPSHAGVEAKDGGRRLPAPQARRGLTDRLQSTWQPGWGLVVAVGLGSVWAAEFGWLAVQRHLAGGSHAEDLGFTDQVLANFLRGQFFRMSLYQGATWNTEIDVTRLARPDSLFAFHFEPMLLLLVPLYAAGGRATLLLVLQAVAVAAGAVPAYRLAAYASGSTLGGLAVACAYLLAPLGQWAVLDDFHTSTLAAPLLLLVVERRVVKRSAVQALAVAALAATAREDVGLVIAALGLVLLVRGQFRGHSWLCASPSSSPPPAAARPPSDELSVMTDRHAGRHMDPEKRHAGVMATSQNGRWLGLSLFTLGLGSTILAALVIRTYSGGVLPFDVRYGVTVGAGLNATLAALARPTVFGYLGTLALSGGWLGILSPLALLPALPTMSLNMLSESPWMATGKAHYSVLVLPFIALGAAAGLRHLRQPRQLSHLSHLHGHPRLPLACAALVLTSVVGYRLEGAGPLGGDYAPAAVTGHAWRADALARSLPESAAVSASSAVVPRVSRRARVYVFPAVLDADYVFLDLQSSPAPTSAGDVFMRVRALLAAGGWNVERAEDGLLLLHRAPGAQPTDIRDLSAAAAAASTESSPMPESGPGEAAATALGSFLDGRVSLLSATLLPSPDAAIDVDGPHGVLRVVWRAEQPLPSGTQLEFWLDLKNAQSRHVWDLASLWWNPPESWAPGQPVTVDIPDVPLRVFNSWRAVWTAHAA